MEKLCVFCRHWDFDGGEPHYSELTPGTDASMSCRKNVWVVNRIHDVDEHRFRQIILTAAKCDFYQLPEGYKP